MGQDDPATWFFRIEIICASWLRPQTSIVGRLVSRRAPAGRQTAGALSYLAASRTSSLHQVKPRPRKAFTRARHSVKLGFASRPVEDLRAGPSRGLLSFVSPERMRLTLRLLLSECRTATQVSAQCKRGARSEPQRPQKNYARRAGKGNGCPLL